VVIDLGFSAELGFQADFGYWIILGERDATIFFDISDIEFAFVPDGAFIVEPCPSTIGGDDSLLGSGWGDGRSVGNAIEPGAVAGGCGVGVINVNLDFSRGIRGCIGNESS